MHESYLHFAHADRLGAIDRGHFIRYAARIMRSVIVDFVREQQVERHGGQADHITLTTQLSIVSDDRENEILEVHEALAQISKFDTRLVQVVELRYFAGMTDKEVAEALGITDRTVRRDWEKARLLLAEALS